MNINFILLLQISVLDCVLCVELTHRHRKLHLH